MYQSRIPALLAVICADQRNFVRLCCLQNLEVDEMMVKLKDMEIEAEVTPPLPERGIRTYVDVTTCPCLLFFA